MTLFKLKKDRKGITVYINGKRKERFYCFCLNQFGTRTQPPSVVSVVANNSIVSLYLVGNKFYP